MYAFTQTTTYPTTAVAPSHLTLLDNFFQLVDAQINEPDNGSLLASNISTADGVWRTPTNAFVGSEQLAQSGRRESLRTLREMRHWVDKIHAHDAAGKELMLLGGMASTHQDGRKIEVQFSARLEIVLVATPEDGLEPRLKFFQGWSSAV